MEVEEEEPGWGVGWAGTLVGWAGAMAVAGLVEVVGWEVAMECVMHLREDQI